MGVWKRNKIRYILLVPKSWGQLLVRLEMVVSRSTAVLPILEMLYCGDL